MRKTTNIFLALAMVAGFAFASRPAAALENGEILVMGFKATLSDYVVTSEGGVMTLKGKGSLDLSPALGAGAIIGTDGMTVDSNGNATLINVTTPEIKIGAFSAKVAPGDIVIKSGEGLAQTFNLNVMINVNLGDQILQVLAAIPITADGVKDAVIQLAPPAGQANFLSKQINDVALALKTATLEIKDGAFSSFNFDGSLSVMGKEFRLEKATVTPTGVSGHAALSDGSLALGSLSLILKDGVDFSYDATGGFKISATNAGIDLSKVISGAGGIALAEISFADGKFHADASITQTVNVSGMSLNLKRIVIDSSKKTDGSAYVKATIDGAIAASALNISIGFTGMEVDSDGNVKGEAKFTPPQTLAIFGVGVSIESIKFQKQDKSLFVGMTGEMLFGTDKLRFADFGIQDGKVNASFDVSATKPFNFSWFPYLKVTQLNIQSNTLTLGGRIEIPDPVKYTFEFKDIKIDSAGQAVSAATAAGTEAWKNLTDKTLIALENTNKTALRIGGFDFYFNAITIPNPLAAIKNKALPDTLLKLYMKAEIPLYGGKRITVNVDGLEITKAGLKDLTLELLPPAGQKTMFEQDFGGVAFLSIDKVKLVIKGGKFESFGLVNGKIVVNAPKLTILFEKIDVDASGNLSGNAKFATPLEIAFFGCGVSIASGSFAVVNKAFSVDLAGEFLLGKDRLAFSSFKINGDGVSAAFDVSATKPFAFSWFPYLKITQFDITANVLTFGGRIEIPDPVKYTFEFKDIKIDSAGQAVSAATAAGTEAWKNLTDKTLIALENTNKTALRIGGFDFYFNAITIPNPLAAIKNKALPDTLLKLYMKAEIPLYGGKRIAINVDGLEITKAGLKDLTLEILPPAGRTTMFEQDFGGVAFLSIDKVKLVIKGGKFESFGLVNGKIVVNAPKLTILFEKIDVDASGNLSGNAKFATPLEIAFFGCGVSIASGSFAVVNKAFSVDLAGEFLLGKDRLAFSSFKINGDGVSAAFDVSATKPFAFSWFPYFKLTQFNIDKNVLTLGGRIDVPDPFKYTFAFSDIKFDPTGLPQKLAAVQTATAGDVKALAAAGLQKARSAIPDTGEYLVLENKNGDPLKLGGFSFYFDAITVPNPLQAAKTGTLPDTLLKLYMRSIIPIGDKKITISVDALEITKFGLKQVLIEVKPPTGQSSIFTQDLGGFASITLNSARLTLKDNKFDSFSFSGAVGVTTPKFNIAFTSVVITADGNVAGSVSMKDTPLDISLCGVGVFISSADFAIKSGSFSIDMAGGIKLGSDTLPFSSFKIDSTGVIAKFAVSKDKPFSFSWFTYLKVTQLEINKSELTFGGRLDLPDPVKYTFAFDNITFDVNGALKKVAASGSTALQAEAQKAWEKISDPALISIVNTNTLPLTIAGAAFYIEAITVPNPFAAVKNKTLPDTLLKLYMRCEIPIGDQKLAIKVDGLEITKSGLKDLTLEIAPAPGQTKLFTTTFFNWAELQIKSAKLVIKSGKFDSFSFSGAVLFDGNGFEITTLSITSSGMQGSLKPVGNAYIGFGGMKLSFGGDISFELTKVAATGTGAGGGGPPATGTAAASATTGTAQTTTSFSITFKKLTLDLSALLGSTAKITCDSLSYTNGDIKAEFNPNIALELAGFQLGLKKLVLESKKPEEGKSRTLDAVIDGNFKIAALSVDLEFKQFKISSSGEIGGEIKPTVTQKFNLYIITFFVDGITISKKPNEPFAISIAGGFELTKGQRINFTSLKFVNGDIEFSLNYTEDKAIPLPICNFVKITKLEIKNKVLTFSGFMDVPVINVRLAAENITYDLNGGLTGGIVKLGAPVTIKLGAFDISITKVEFNLSTKYLAYDGKITLPKDVMDVGYEFKGMGLQLASNNTVTEDTSKTNVASPGDAKDVKNGFPLKISKVGFGSKDGIYILSLTGQINFQNKFLLNFETLKIGTDKTFKKWVFTLGKVTGAIKLASFSVEITDFQINSEAADPYVTISGGMQMPSFGGVKVDGLTIYKSGKITLTGLELKMDKGAYKVIVQVSFADSAFKGRGAITLPNGIAIDVSILISPTEFKLDVAVSGLNITLFPGVTLDGVGGGIHCKYSPFWMEFRISATLGIVNANILSGTASLVFNTDGVVTISAQLNLFKSIKLADAVITLDIPKKTLSGTCNIGYEIAGIVKVSVQLQMYFSSSDWYIKGTGRASIIGKDIASVDLLINKNGFSLHAKASFDISIVSAYFDFKFVITASGVSLNLEVGGTVNFGIFSASASFSLAASFDGSGFKGKVSLKGCIYISLWLLDCDTCRLCWGCVCDCLWCDWCGCCWTTPYPCNCRWVDHGGSSCVTLSINLKIDKNGLSIWL